MAKVLVGRELCKGCQICLAPCPQKIMQIGNTANSKGYLIAELSDPAKCTACRICAVVCPESAITVYA